MLRARLLSLSDWVAIPAIAALVLVPLLVLRGSRGLERLELGAHDRFVRLLHEDARPDPRIVLVRIREADIRQYGQPLSDELLARALRSLQEHEPRAIGVDLYRDQPRPPGQENLQNVVLGAPGITMIEKIGERESEAVPPPEWLIGTGQVGFSDVVLDVDGRLRRGLLAMLGREGGGISLGLRAVLSFLAREPDDDRPLIAWVPAPGEKSPTLHLRGVPIPRFRADDAAYAGADDGGYQVLLDALRLPRAGLELSLADVLEGRVEDSAIRDRIVLLGTTAPSVRDDVETSLGRIHGIEHHAQLAGYLLALVRGETAPLRFPGERQEAMLVALLALGAAALGVRLRSNGLLAASFVFGLGVLVGGALLARGAGLWLPIVPATAGWTGALALGVAYASSRERTQQRFLMDLFGRFLARDVMEELWRQKNEFLHGGRPRPQRAVVTVLMADLEGYTAATGKLEPERFVAWINEFLAAMAEVIGRHRGVVDSYAGDGVMAIFGVPIPRRTEAEMDDDARNAADCALSMGRELRRLVETWMARGLPSVSMRVGLYTGEAVVGVVGSPDRLKYSCLGDTVNTAARLESMRKDEFAEEAGIARTRVLAGESTVRRLADRYEITDLGLQELKGRLERVRVYRILDPIDRKGTPT
jgi:adenylate cyclase